MPKNTLDLARALKRYTRMRPENAYGALAKEWTAAIVAIVSDVLWSNVKGRTAKTITREIVALVKKAQAAHVAMRNTQCRNGYRPCVASHVRDRAPRVWSALAANVSE